jgi:cell division topological specificity factor
MNINHIVDRLNDFFNRPQKSAKCAKERLQIIISHERAARDKPDYLAMLQQDLIDVISKYVSVDKNDVRVDVERKDGCAILELNVTLPQNGAE